MKARTPNRLEKALVKGALDTSRRVKMFHTLLAEAIWFPLKHRPEVTEVLHPAPGDPLSLWICSSAEDGLFTPVFTSREVMKEAMARFPTPHAVATMPGQHYFDAAARLEHAVFLNPGSQYRLHLPLPAVRDLASGKLIRDLTTKPDRTEATIRFLKPEQLPSALLQEVFDQCLDEPCILGVWLGDLRVGTEEPPDLEHLHAVVWVFNASRTPTDHLEAVLNKFAGGHEVTMIRFDEVGSAAALKMIRGFPALYTRPVPPPG